MHLQLQGRKRIIFHGFNQSGECEDNHEGMCSVIKDYYTNIFVDSIEADVDPTMNARTVSGEQNTRLVEEVTFEEFSLAIKQMHPDKASRPDGLNPAFFQHFWSSTGREVYDCCKVWFHECSFPTELNNTNLVLIPKKANINFMKDFRSKALCNVLYKILAKVLANRLKYIEKSINFCVWS